MKKWVYALAVLALTACGYVNLDEVSRGRFEGNVHLIWVRGGEQKLLGDGEFIYLPFPGDELTYYRKKGPWRSAGTEVIKPEAFYTDGGSVPRFAQGISGLNAWAYGPAYIIHDWVFVARKCLNDEALYTAENSPITDEMRKISNMSFKESAYLMAETIATVVARGDAEIDTSDLIAPFTAGPRSHGLWMEKGVCEDNLVPQETVDQLLAFTRRQAFQPRVLGAKRTVAPQEVSLPDGRIAVFLGTLPALSQ